MRGCSKTSRATGTPPTPRRSLRPRRADRQSGRAISPGSPTISRTRASTPKAAALYKKILKIKPGRRGGQLQLGEISVRQGLLADAKRYSSRLAERRRPAAIRPAPTRWLYVWAASIRPTSRGVWRRHAARAEWRGHRRRHPLSRAARRSGREEQAGRGPRGPARSGAAQPRRQGRTRRAGARGAADRRFRDRQASAGRGNGRRRPAAPVCAADIELRSGTGTLIAHAS